MRYFRLSTMLVLLALTFGVLQDAAAQTSSWLTYIDPRYGFTVQYPANWTVSPRDDRPGTYGGILSFEPRLRSDASSPVQVVIGLYTLEYDNSLSLAQWEEQYKRLNAHFRPSETTIKQSASVPSMAADHGEALSIQGVSPLTQYQVTKIPRGEIVWFVWTNGGTDVSETYSRMVDSLRFTAKTPRTLAQAFGLAFRPQPRQRHTPAPQAITGVIDLPDSTWWVPTPAGANYTVNCGSPKHTGTASYAADISMVDNTGVYSTHRSWVDSAGWDDTGYGNLLVASTDFIYSRSYSIYYAHLTSFAASPGQEIAATRLIAYSGHSGGVPPHLHFHVFSISDAVNLRNLNYFDENAYYPSGYAACGTMHR